METARREAIALARAAGVPVDTRELERITANDFGLGAIRREGFQYVDLTLTPLLRVSLLVVLPDQMEESGCLLWSLRKVLESI